MLRHKLGQRAGIPEGVDPSPARAAMRSSKFDKRDKAVLAAAWTGMIWTNHDLEKAGYIVDGLCCLCKAAPDTLRHRLWQCQHPDAVEARKAIPTSVVKEALDEDSPGSTCAWDKSVANVWPEAAHKSKTTFGRWTEQSQSFNDREKWDEKLEGDLFLDGSCYPGLVKAWQEQAGQRH